MFTLCFVALCFVLGLGFIFLIHFAPFMHHYHCSYLHLLPSFLLDPLSIRDKKGESILWRVYQGAFVISTWLLCTSLRGEILFLVHICRGKDIPLRRCIYQGGEDNCINKKTLFCLCFFKFVFLFALWCFELCLVSMLCCSHCIVFGHAYILMLLCFIECMFG